MAARKSWWGHSAVVFGAGEAGESIVKTLTRDPALGLRPIAVVDNDCSNPELFGVPVVSAETLARNLRKTNSFAYAIITKSGAAGQQLLSSVESLGYSFSNVIFMSEVTDLPSLWVRPRSIGAMAGLEICHGFRSRETQIAKRILDLSLTLGICLFFAPLLAALAIAVRLDSEGPIFYGQRRIGRNQTGFRAWKFRSMVQNAEQVLQEHLDRDPALRAEWNRDHKLKDDPRITRVGKLLRKTSLDELPQLWNVLNGEMSLVGPRPIVQAEVEKYGEGFDLYTKVHGGVTGLWQVSGRNDISYDERVRLDCFYVRNWSVWLDLCILFRTVGTVLLRKGAY